MHRKHTYEYIHIYICIYRHTQTDYHISSLSKLLPSSMNCKRVADSGAGGPPTSSKPRSDTDLGLEIHCNQRSLLPVPWALDLTRVISIVANVWSLLFSVIVGRLILRI